MDLKSRVDINFDRVDVNFQTATVTFIPLQNFHFDIIEHQRPPSTPHKFQPNIPNHLVNRKSAESGVAPAGIMSHKFLFELKKTILQYSED